MGATDLGSGVQGSTSDHSGSVYPATVPRDGGGGGGVDGDVNGDVNGDVDGDVEQCPLKRAEELYADDRLLAAARAIRSLSAGDGGKGENDQDGSNADAPLRLNESHRAILADAGACEELVSSLKAVAAETAKTGKGGGWKSQMESHGHHQSIVGYVIGGESGNELSARMETPVERSLLVPILSVLNETDLYKTWLPNFEIPRFKVKHSRKLRQTGRCSQILAVSFELPWPIPPREVVIDAVGFDDIDDDGVIGIRLESLNTGDRGGIVPEPDGDSTVRVIFQGGFLFQKCPRDHPALVKMRKKRLRQRAQHQHRGLHRHQRSARHQGKGSVNTSGGGEEEEEAWILVTYTMSTDAKLMVLPKGFVNFIAKTALSAIWNKVSGSNLQASVS